MVERLRKERLCSHPAGTLILATEMQRQIARYRINTARVQEYEDKQRVQAFIDSVQTLLTDCRRAITPDAKDDVELCLTYKAEETDLRQLIDWAHKREQQKMQIEKLAQIKPQTDPRLAYGMIISGVLLGLAVIPFLSADAPWAVLPLVIAVVIFIFGIVGLVQPPTPEAKRVQTAVAEATAMLEQQFQNDVLGQLQKKFGQHDSAGPYETLLAEREKFIDTVLNLRAQEQRVLDRV
jgi:hypothetical protein